MIHALKAFGFLLCASLSTPVAATEFFVAPDGATTADGSKERPWNLATAVSHPQSVRPGDTIWLRGGTYRGGYLSELKGTAEKPIIVRQMPNSRVILDLKPREAGDNGLLDIRGEYATYWGFEATCSDPKRETQLSGSWPDDIQRGGIVSRGSHIRLINLVVHDTGGIAAWSEGEGGEVYGCLIYYNGWKGPDRAHGHAIYAQNLHGTKRLIDNVVFWQFGYGIHCYGSPKASLQGFHVEGNAGFKNNSLSSPDGCSTDIYIGGQTPAKRITITNNYTNGGLRCGYPWGVMSEDATITDNYLVGGLYVRDFRQLTVIGNTVIAPDSVAWLEGSKELDTSPYKWDKNNYFRTGKEWASLILRVGEKTRGVEFAGWQSATGIDAHSTCTQSQPTGTHVFVRPNKYEPGRANIIVYNWDEQKTVDVDLSNVLMPGQKYRIVGAQNFFGQPVTEGKYDGKPVPVPMQPAQIVQPVGMPDLKLPPLQPKFGVFVALVNES